MSAERTNATSSRGSLMSFPWRAEELNFSPKIADTDLRGENQSSYRETRGKKVKLIYVKLKVSYSPLFKEKRKS